MASPENRHCASGIGTLLFPENTKNNSTTVTLMSSLHRQPDTTKQSCLCRVWRSGVNWGQLLLTCSDFKSSVGDSLELSGIQFTTPKRTRYRQDSFVVSGASV